MKHVTYSEKSLLIGDRAADVLTEYAAALGDHGKADSVTLSGVGVDGEEVEATFVLNSGTVLMAESTESKLPEPRNDAAIKYMEAGLAELAPRRPASGDVLEPLEYTDTDSL